jgi:hypothetical protein
MARLLYGSGHLSETTKANLLLTCREDRLSVFHALSPPPLATVCDESNDGEYGSMLMIPLYYTTSQLSITFGTLPKTF